MVDDADYEWLTQWKWHCLNGTYAARRNPAGGLILMHREVNKTPKGWLTDHINRNGLDNRRKNLRTATNQINRLNATKQYSQSGYKGVYASLSRLKPWAAKIKVKGRFIHLGLFVNPRHAAMMYDLWAREIFGDNARPNFIPVGPSSNQ